MCVCVCVCVHACVCMCVRVFFYSIFCYDRYEKGNVF